ncbi:MAG TPA: alpha/beta fold hydrolase [Blastocatellia bacterium]|nr:alpha/beta fold hydrolase [Blastocatellia bacterium]
MTEQFKVVVDDLQSVTATLYPATSKTRARITLILGHGAGSGQTSGFMVTFADALSERGIDVVTFNFSYIERGRHVPDPGDKLEACYRAVIDAARAHKKLKGNKLAIGGKSMGGRIGSQVAAKGLDDVAGLVFLGYPLHPPGKPEQLRSKHLPNIKAPMLFVQGSRDSFGTPEELRPILKKLKTSCKLYEVEGGDHSLKVPKKAGSQEEVYAAVQDKMVQWLRNNM